MKKYKIFTANLRIANDEAAEILFATPVNKLKVTEEAQCPQCRARILEKICFSCGFPNTEVELDACEKEFEERLQKAMEIGGVKIISK